MPPTTGHTPLSRCLQRICLRARMRPQSFFGGVLLAAPQCIYAAGINVFYAFFRAATTRAFRPHPRLGSTWRCSSDNANASSPRETFGIYYRAPRLQRHGHGTVSEVIEDPWSRGWNGEIYLRPNVPSLERARGCYTRVLDSVITSEFMKIVSREFLTRTVDPNKPRCGW